MTQSKNKNIYLAILWIFFGGISRLIPHPANVTPLINLSLFAGSQLSRLSASIFLILTLLLSDIGLHYLQHLPFIGNWMIFTYSGLLIITLAGRHLTLNPSWHRLLCFTTSASLGYWLWTNFGTWLLSGIYPKTIAGVLICYSAALPFLRNSLLGDLFWMAIIFGSYKTANKSLLKFQTRKESLCARDKI